MIRRPPRSTRTDTLVPTRRSSDLAALGMIDDDSADALILSPLKQGLVNGCHHARGERMNGFWAVQANAADAAFSGNQDFIGHWRSMSIATIIRLTWRPEESRVGKEWVSTCRSRWVADH